MRYTIYIYRENPVDADYFFKMEGINRRKVGEVMNLLVTMAQYVREHWCFVVEPQEGQTMIEVMERKADLAYERSDAE